MHLPLSLFLHDEFTDSFWHLPCAVWLMFQKSDAVVCQGKDREQGGEREKKRKREEEGDRR